MHWLKVSVISLVTLLAANAFAVDAIFTPWTSNLAIRGYDPVAYFLEDKAVEGRSSFEYEWKEATWRFSNAENMNLFTSNPEDYAPQYGGYCAYAVANGSTASVDPTQFTIIDGKLYLNYSRSVKQKWLVNTSDFIAKADQNWPGLLAK